MKKKPGEGGKSDSEKRVGERKTESDKFVDEKALSITVGYIINLGVIGIAVTTGLLLTQGVIGDIQGNALEEGISSTGQVVAGEIEGMDTLVSSGDVGDVTRVIELPEIEGGYSVSIEYTSSDIGLVNVTSNAESAYTSIEFDNQTAIRDAGSGVTVSGQDEITLRYDESSNELVIEE